VADSFVRLRSAFYDKKMNPVQSFVSVINSFTGGKIRVSITSVSLAFKIRIFQRKARMYTTITYEKDVGKEILGYLTTRDIDVVMMITFFL